MTHCGSGFCFRPAQKRGKKNAQVSLCGQQGEREEKTIGGQPGLPMPRFKFGANPYDIHISRRFPPSRFFMIFRPI